jgi:hypothetical protein
LNTVRVAGHSIILTETLSDEWNRHQSRFTTKWLRGIFAARKVIEQEMPPNEDFRKHVSRMASNTKSAEIMLKDCHLIEAALATEHRVVSIDDEARHHFRQVASRVKPLQGVCWVNPAVADERPLEWLRRNAPLDRHRLLGAVADAGD